MPTISGGKKRRKKRGKKHEIATTRSPVEAHGGKDEGGAGQGDDLQVGQHLAGHRPQHPLTEGHEEDLRRHGADAHRQVAHSQVDDEDVHAAVPLPVAAARQHHDDHRVAHQGQGHDEGQGRHALDDVRGPDVVGGDRAGGGGRLEDSGVRAVGGGSVLCAQGQVGGAEVERGVVARCHGEVEVPKVKL